MVQYRGAQALHRPDTAVLNHLLTRPVRTFLRLKARSSRLSRPGHAGRQVVAWTVLALLFLNIVIIHPHVELHGGHVFVPKKLLQAEWIVA